MRFRTTLLLVAPLTLINTLAYLLLNNFPLSEPSLLPMTAIDRAVPFLVWTVWPYALLLLSDVVLPFLIRDRRRFLDMLRAYAVAISCNVLIWAIFPTTFPRPPAPEGDSLTASFYNLMVSVDTPNCCFPSGHITIPAILVWTLGRQHPRAAAPLWIAFALLSVTIVTTRQHYLVDLFGGLGTAMIGVAAAAMFTRLTGPSPESQA